MYDFCLKINTRIFKFFFLVFLPPYSSNFCWLNYLQFLFYFFSKYEMIIQEIQHFFIFFSNERFIQIDKTLK